MLGGTRVRTETTRNWSDRIGEKKEYGDTWKGYYRLFTFIRSRGKVSIKDIQQEFGFVGDSVESFVDHATLHPESRIYETHEGSRVFYKWLEKEAEDERN